MVVTHGSLQSARGRCALTIGNFDGVHRGHRALIDRVTAKARELGLTSCVLTFEPHPREFFARDAAPARLTRLRDKLELMAAAGVEARARRALRRALRGALGRSASSTKCWCAAWACAGCWSGRDFRFGERRAGDFAHAGGRGAAARLPARGDARRAVRGRARVELGGARRARRRATCRAPSGCSGHPYTISGRVAHGAKLGRGLGFPTANIVLRRTAAARRASSRWRSTASEGKPAAVAGVASVGAPPDGQPGGDPAAGSAPVRLGRRPVRQRTSRCAS